VKNFSRSKDVETPDFVCPGLSYCYYEIHHFFNWDKILKGMGPVGGGGLDRVNASF
jgi:hypothetical protein